VQEVNAKICLQLKLSTNLQEKCENARISEEFKIYDCNVNQNKTIKIKIQGSKSTVSDFIKYTFISYLCIFYIGSTVNSLQRLFKYIFIENPTIVYFHFVLQ